MILRRREKQTLDALEDLVDVSFATCARNERPSSRSPTAGCLYAPNRNLARPLDNARPPTYRCQHRSAQRQADDARTRRTRRATRAPAVRPIATRCRSSTTNSASGRFSTRRTARTSRSIRSTRAASSCSTSRSCRLPGSASDRPPTRRCRRRSTTPASSGAATRCGCWPRRPTASPSSARNDIEKGFKRITDDLSAYYLLGYYSTGKLDGRFHSIRVRVKRAGVEVRARRGYLAPSAADVARGLPKAPRSGAPGAEAPSQPLRPRRSPRCPARCAISRCACT